LAIGADKFTACRAAGADAVTAPAATTSSRLTGEQGGGVIDYVSATSGRRPRPQKRVERNYWTAYVHFSGGGS
jgi:hypothetical protein